MAREGVSWKECVMVGDDLPDVAMLERAGWAVASPMQWRGRGRGALGDEKGAGRGAVARSDGAGAQAQRDVAVRFSITTR